MKAAVYYETGGPEVFRYEDVPDPAVGPGEVLVRVEAVSIEGGDTLNRLGGAVAQPRTSSATSVPAPCCRRRRRASTPSRRATGWSPWGWTGPTPPSAPWPSRFCWVIPDGVATEEAACVPVPFGTADDCLFEFGRLQPGETALIHAGASGVGIAAIQLAKRAGATVLATASSDQRLDRLAELGLDHGINYATDDFVDEVRRLTDGRGADVIVDSIGGSTLQKSLLCLAYRGRCITFGDAGREQSAKLDISTMRANNQTLVGYFLGAELFLGPRAHAMIARLLADIASGGLKVVIDRRFAARGGR